MMLGGLLAARGAHREKRGLTIRRKDEYPVQHATTQNNLGNAVMHLPCATAEERAENVRRAIECYEEALSLRQLLPDQGARVEQDLAKLKEDTLGDARQGDPPER